MAQKKIIIIVILIIIVLSVIFLPGYTKLQDIITENKNLGNRIHELQNSAQQLTEEKERLESDIIYIEKIAREKMGLIKKGERKIERE